MKKILLVALAAVVAFGLQTSCHKDRVTYTVTFNSQGGSPVDPQIVEEGDHVHRPENPTREGYNFVDWHLSGVDAAWNFTRDVVESNITLMARWAVVGDAGLGELTELVADMEEVERNGYSQDAWEAFQAALLAAQDVLDDADPTPTRIAEALNNLKAARDGLVAPDKTDLLSELETAGDIDPTNYTTASWAPFQSAIDDGWDVYEDADSTKEDIEAAIGALETAFEGLVRVPTEAI